MFFIHCTFDNVRNPLYNANHILPICAAHMEISVMDNPALTLQ